MDVNTTPTATAAVIGKSPERDIDAPPRIQPSKATNGVLKRHFLPHAPPKEFHAPLGGLYKECLKNHAASIGGHALDGCGEFMPAPTATAADPTSLKCAACGCHRNFHRREPEDFPVVIEYHPHHRHHPLPPPPTAHGPPPARESHSPPPISSSYPHMLLALSGGAGGGGATQNLMNSSGSGHPSTRKRFRTKFTQEQKEKMFELAERVGWKMQKTNEDVVNGVCSDIGVERGVFKVWMHNNKNTFAKRSSATNAVSDLRNGKNDDDDEENNNGGVLTHHTHLQEDDHHHHHHHHHHYNGKSNESNAPANASSSSS